MPRVLLSSKLTPFYKIFFIAAPLLYWVGMIRLYFLGWFQEIDSFIFTIVSVSTLIMLAHGAWLAWQGVKTCRVEADDENFYISNFGKETVVPRSDLFEATELRWVKPYWVTLKLRRPSDFGDRILFIPPWRVGAFWTANPLIEKLNASRSRW